MIWRLCQACKHQKNPWMKDTKGAVYTQTLIKDYFLHLELNHLTRKYTMVLSHLSSKGTMMLHHPSNKYSIIRFIKISVKNQNTLPVNVLITILSLTVTTGHKMRKRTRKEKGTRKKTRNLDSLGNTGSLVWLKFLGYMNWLSIQNIWK